MQTDLSGGITGAQASIYTRAADALDKCLPLFDGLYPLDSEAEAEDATALRELAKSQLGEIVKEFGAVGGPSVLRVDTYFQILLGTAVPLPVRRLPPTRTSSSTARSSRCAMSTASRSSGTNSLTRSRTSKTSRISASLWTT